jgi:dihydropteroate synthase
VDTRRAVVAGAALDAGASIVNDVSAGADPEMFPVVAGTGSAMVLMHMLGSPKTMQDAPRYADVVAEVTGFLRERLEAAMFGGVEGDRLAVDPGIGFGKDLGHNLALLRSMPSLADLGAPVVVGASRKRFLGVLTGVDEPRDRLEASVAAAVWCAANGADVVRVHDVAPTVRALAVTDAIARGGA